MYFYDLDVIPSLRSLEENWQIILGELKALERAHFVLWPERELYSGDGWKVFGLLAFGRTLAQNCKLCPNTMRVLESIPGLVTAGFSRLVPGTKIAPHCGYDGYSGYFLRCHLGLEVPAESDCGLNVGPETRRWLPGKCLLFDDSFEHSAWNNGPGERTVLLMDVRNPLRPEAPPGGWVLTQEIIDALRSFEAGGAQ